MKAQIQHRIPGWVTIRLDTDDPPAEVVKVLDDLSERPGVTMDWWDGQGAVALPQNMQQTRAVDALFDVLELPKRPRVRRMRTFEAEHHLRFSRRELFPHQVSAVNFLVENNGGLLADDMGLGKTTSAIVAAEALAELHAPDRPRVIIAPNYTRGVWRRELLACGAIESEDDFSFAVGRDPTTGALNRRAKWWFIHYDIAKYWAGVMRIGPRGAPVVAIIDEMHWIKNGRASRSQAAHAIAGVASARIGLTGTPIENRPSELWWPLTVIDGRGSWGAPQAFRQRYCGAYNDGYGLRDGHPTHTDELKERLERRYLRRETAEVALDLPELRRQRIDVPLTSAGEDDHRKLMGNYKHDELLKAILSGRAGQDTIALITGLRKLTSRAKIETTTRYALDCIENGESVVVFTWERGVAQRIANAVARGAPVDTPTWCITGAVPQVERDIVVDAFQASERPGCLVATLGALREGVTLHRARFIVIHDLDWVPSRILQAEKRIHRIGQHRPCVAAWMIAERSIDTMLAAALVAKAQAISETLGTDAAQHAVDELDLTARAAALGAEAEVDDLWNRWVHA